MAGLTSLIPAGSARAHQVCVRACGPTDAACTAAMAACNLRIDAYNIYMDQMGAGQTKFALPDVYVDILRPQYPQGNFNAYRFGFSNRQPPGNATTDCMTTYFNSQSYVDAVRTADENTNYHWLLHEVEHIEQCGAAGGREGYANRWWNELMAAAAAAGRTINFNQTPDALAGQLGMLFGALHDMMPMERAADAKAAAVEPALRRCCISQGNKPIRPLALGPITDQADPPGSTIRHRLSITATDGDSPFTATWKIKNPGDAAFETQPASLVHGLDLLWTPEKDPSKAEVTTTAVGQTLKWKYDIQVEVAQQDGDLDHKNATKSITLTETKTSGTTVGGGKLGEPTVPGIPSLPKELPPSSQPGLPSPGGPGLPPGSGPTPLPPPKGPPLPGGGG